MVQCSSTLMEQWETFRQSESMKRLKTSPTHGVRLSKIKSACEHFSEAVHSCAEEFLDSYEKYVDKNGGASAHYAKQIGDVNTPFPSCIEKNMEAYFQGPWRKIPFEHRLPLNVCIISKDCCLPQETNKCTLTLVNNVYPTHCLRWLPLLQHLEFISSCIVRQVWT